MTSTYGADGVKVEDIPTCPLELRWCMLPRRSPVGEPRIIFQGYHAAILRSNLSAKDRINVHSLGPNNMVQQCIEADA